MTGGLGRTRRALGAVGVGAVVLAGSGVAWAFWTSSGGGTGSARVADTAPAVTLHASTSGALLPGTAIPVQFSADNPSPAGLRVSSVHLVAITADEAHAGCAVSDFSMADVTIGQVVPPRSTGFALTGTGVLQYADTASDQSACIGATLTLSISSG